MVNDLLECDAIKLSDRQMKQKYEYEFSSDKAEQELRKVLQPAIANSIEHNAN